MRTILLILCFIFGLNQFAEAQQSNEFLGGIKLSDTALIPYKIEFKINRGRISGVSTTDFGGAHETKSEIVGFYDDINQLISFNETNIIYTKSPISQEDFCNVYFQPTRFKLGKTKFFTGFFKGKFRDGTTCIDGEIYLNSKENIEKQMARVTKKVERSKKISDSVKTELKQIKIMDSVNLNVLKNKEITSIFTKSKSVKFAIFDGSQVDDDVVTVLNNGKTILFRHKISKTKKILEIEVVSQKTTITVISESTGTIGNNTAFIEISDDEHTVKTMTNLKKGEKTMVDILKRD